MKINWKVRIKNPMFVVQIILSILAPVLSYLGLKVSDLTTWEKLFDVLLIAISNPYVLSLIAISIYNALTDPTTKGFGDSEQALTYDKPKSKEIS